MRFPPKAKMAASVTVLLVACGYVAVRFDFIHLRKTFTIGIAQWVSSPEYQKNVNAFKAELARRGYTEGKNVRFLSAIAKADKTEQRRIITEFKKAHVDLVYSLTTPGTLVARDILSTTPIVFSIVTYPVETGVVAALSNSGCNAVGTRNYMPPSRQFYFFERVYSSAKRIAFVHRAGEPNSTIQLKEFRDLLSARNIEVVEVAANNITDLREKLLSVLPTVDAVYSACDTLIQSGGEDVVIALCKEFKRPDFSCNKDGVTKGSLIGDVADFKVIGKIAGEKAAQILAGASPQWLATESPRDDYVIVNLKTARELGVTVPDDVVGRASEIIR
jgi:putative ABC transport system substrate-binding protein